MRRPFLLSVCRRGGVKLSVNSQFHILVVGREYEWIDRFRFMPNHARVRTQLWFTIFLNLENLGAVQSIWLPSLGDRKTSLRDLSFLPKGKEGGW